MDSKNSSEEEEEEKRNFSTELETLTEEDPTRFQRRHFPNRKTSDIFFCDSPLENSSRKCGDDIYASAGMDTRYNDQKQSESRHFHISSEDGKMTRDYPDQDKEEQVDSSETLEPKKSVGRDDFLSEETDKHNTDLKKYEKRHFHSSFEDGNMTRDYPNQDEGKQVDLSETAKPRKSAGRDDFVSEEMHNARHHFPNRMTSDIFFCNSPLENSSRKCGDDIYASAGVDTRYNDQKQSERRHFHISSEDGTMTRDYPDQDNKIKRRQYIYP